MKDDERIFDFLAAAEDTGRQLDELLKALPGEMRAVLAAEYRQSPWLAALPATADKVTAAAERAEAAAGMLTRKAIAAGVLVCAAAIILPLAIWGYAYWQTHNLRQEKGVLQAEIHRLENAVSSFGDKHGGGPELLEHGERTWMIILPQDTELERKWELPDGRFGYTYTIP